MVITTSPGTGSGPGQSPCNDTRTRRGAASGGRPDNQTRSSVTRNAPLCDRSTSTTRPVTGP